MPFSLLSAVQEDIPALVDIFFTAFANDALFNTCYPDTTANREWWVKAVVHQMQHSSTIVMKVTDDQTGEAVSFAKWSIQKLSESNHPDAKTPGAVQPNDPSPDMKISACKSLAEAQYKMRAELMGGRDHIWLNALATLPKHQCQGAATMLVQWGTQKAELERLECFSACTNNAKANVRGILGRTGWSLRGSEIVLPDSNLSVFGGWKA